MCFSGVHLGDTIINTLSMSCFVDKTTALCTLLSAKNHHKMIMYENKLSIWKLVDNVRQMIDHVYCLHELIQFR